MDGRILTFELQDGIVRDAETGSTWNMEKGLAVESPLQGQTLRTVSYIPGLVSAWDDFFREPVVG